MADQRTLPATPRRRQKARAEGRVARSAEIGPALGLLVASWALGAAGRLAAPGFAAWAAGLWGRPPGELGVTAVAADLRQAVALAALAAAPVAVAAMAAGVLATGAQTGFLVSLGPLRPRLDVLNPLRGAQRLLSARAAAELVRALLKTAAVAGAIYGPVRTLVVQLPASADQVVATAALVWQACLGTLSRAGLALLAVAAADVLYQRWELDRSLRMSREELREELRETEGDPLLRAQRRRRQRELARRRMMADVRRADVVITNPTHYAVALRYEPRRQHAPMVVAKGRGLLAERIKAVAAAANVIITENPPLARELYRGVPLGRPIPPALYRAVAEVLAFVWRVKGKEAPA
jgi:flagellar biosynthetic protein FlhB